MTSDQMIHFRAFGREIHPTGDDAVLLDLPAPERVLSEEKIGGEWAGTSESGKIHHSHKSTRFCLRHDWQHHPYIIYLFRYTYTDEVPSYAMLRRNSSFSKSPSLPINLPSLHLFSSHLSSIDSLLLPFSYLHLSSLATLTHHVSQITHTQ